MPTPDALLSAIAPELDEVDAAIREIHLELAESQTGTVYKAARPHAVALLAAHMMTMAGREGFAGAVASKKEGQLAVGFQATGIDDELAATSYGAELMRLRKGYIFAARTALV